MLKFPRQTFFEAMSHIRHCTRLIYLFFLICLPGLSYAKSNVDIAIFYTQEVAKYMDLAQLHRLVQKRTHIANQALAHAGIDLHRNLVAFDPVLLHPEIQSNPRLFLSKRQNGKALLAQAKRFGADYITVLTTDSDAHGCGLAQVGGRIALVIVSQKCNKPEKDYLLAHEWGHLDGAAHSERDSIKAKLKFGVGYVCDGKSTIMNMQTTSAHKQLIYAQADTCGKADVADVVRLIKQRMELPDAIQNSQPTMAHLGAVTLAVKHRVISETSALLQGQLLLSEPLAEVVSVQLFTQDVTTEGDFVGQIKRYAFLPGQTRVAFSIAVINDSLHEADERLLVGLRYPENVKLSNPLVEVTIVSDDGP